jgi:hypothetical protein
VNCQLPIANCQLLGAARRGFSRGRKDCRQFPRFLLQVIQSARWYKLIVTNQLQPKLHFVGFLLGNANLRDKSCARTGFARRSVIRGSRRPGAGNLIRQYCLSRLVEVCLPNSKRGERTSSCGFSILQDS